MGGRLYIGTSGWNYPEWKDEFYAGVPQKQWLRFYAERLRALEVNGTFYHQMKPATFAKWRLETPADFRFAIKAHRYITHVRRLEAPLESIERQRDSATELGEKLAAVLWQMPQSLKQDLALLESFTKKLNCWSGARHVLEFRHDSWFVGPVAEFMGRHKLAVCQSDAADWPMWDAVTSDLVYVRLHGHKQTYASTYSPQSLKQWAARIKRWLGEGRDAHVYFDNTASGNAPRNALGLVALLS